MRVRPAARALLALLAATVVLLAVTGCGRREPPADAVAGADSATRTQLVGGLHTVTLVTADADAGAVRDFYANFGLRPLSLAPSAAADLDAEADLWGVSAEIAASAFVLANPADPVAPRLRVLTVPASAPQVRAEYSVRRDGGASLGFACAPTPGGAAALEWRFGLKAASGFALVVPRPDGRGEYTVEQAYYHAPENVLLPCVTRPADVAPIAPIDAARGVGGPAYAGITVTNVDQEAAFYQTVLGLEKRRDMELRDPKLLAAAGLPTDATVRFVQVFAPNLATANLTLVDLGASGERNPHTRPPARGLTLWTFQVRDLLEVRRRLKSAQGVVVAGPVAARSAYFGPYKAMTALTPAGTLLEFVELPQ